MASYSRLFSNGQSLSEFLVVDGAWSIQNNDLLSGTGGDFPAWLQYDTPLDSTNQYSKIRYTNNFDGTATPFVGVFICGSDGLKTGYGAYIRESGSVSSIFESVNGVRTILVDTGLGTAPPFDVRLERVGSDLKLYKDDVLVASHTIVGTPLSGLYSGLIGHNGNNARANSFATADIAAPVPTLGTITTGTITANSIGFSVPVTY